ncbi:MAG: FtsX-like permease family protein [Bauldia sp.]|nr:FtsX-like permease family protein [Bauldia sp.]
MNPAPIAFATIRRYPATTILFIVVIAVAIALGVGISAQERAIRNASTAAADRFDLLVAAPGSPINIVLNTIFLQPSTVELLDGDIVASLMENPRVEYAAPVAFGDSIQGYSVIGTIPAFVERLSDGLADGRMFATHSETVIGADVPFPMGATLIPAHGQGFVEGGHHEYQVQVVGRMKRMGNPWDRAVVVPVETIWEVHDLPTGHPEGSEQIGPPFEAELVPGLPAVVVRSNQIGALYSLRSEYSTDRSMAFFPAEVLLQLYSYLGDIRSVMSVMAVVSEILVFLAIFAGVVALMKLFERQFAVLRALGASRLYIFVAVWLFASSIVAVGALIGLGLGFGAAQIGSSIISEASGMSLSATIGRQEVILAAVGALAGIILATLPAALLYRGSVASILR